MRRAAPCFKLPWGAASPAVWARCAVLVNPSTPTRAWKSNSARSTLFCAATMRASPATRFNSKQPGATWAANAWRKNWKRSEPRTSCIETPRANCASRTSISPSPWGSLFAPLYRQMQRLISQRLAGFQRERHALLSFLFAAERNEGFALEVQHVLLAHELRRRKRAACQDVCELASYVGVVVRDITAALHHVNHKFCARQKLFAEHFDLRGLRSLLPARGRGLVSATNQRQRGFFRIAD